MVLVYILCFLYVITFGNGRGPHHPRGGKVIKHHVHYKPARGDTVEKLTQDEQLLHDKAHIQTWVGTVQRKLWPNFNRLSETVFYQGPRFFGGLHLEEPMKLSTESGVSSVQIVVDGQNDRGKVEFDFVISHNKNNQEHLEDEIKEADDLSNLSDEELEFYYFQLHDTDKNSKLDGLEILQALVHTSHQDDRTSFGYELLGEMNSLKSDDEFGYFVEIIDRVLEEDDSDRDGYLSYPEFVDGGRRSKIDKQPVVLAVK